MKELVGVLLLTCFAIASQLLTVFGHQWAVIDSSDWRVETLDGYQVLHLLKPRGPLPGPRRPVQFALAQTLPLSRVHLELDARPRQRSLIIVFAYQDPAHFDYAHLSIDTGVQQPMHNGIFHVYGGERVRISSTTGAAAFPETNRWYHLVLDQNGQSGSVQVTVDSRAVPALHAIDLSLGSGRVGLGSFDEIGDFRDVKLGSTVFLANSTPPRFDRFIRHDDGIRSMPRY